MSNSDEMRRKLEKMESDLNDAASTVAQEFSSEGSANFLKPLAETFNKLGTVAKVGAIAVALILGLAILSTVLKLLMSAIVVAVLLFAGYLGYKFLLAEDS
ncbi:hypothetical protein Lepto7376_3640 [[Leptolyngbya] sp. PCC 7376]|uniref:hypothetical protein n=1 Tax=[Leptolyngbya] sp. PCC 7376 TaxID=111781 RepID=UPI00029EE51C|nr:hypothetical protein [[Leptolyngbya] sp. PCC 7376]AFY39820.1 hypothetical protein Lepto7376_3640 [[Leptolyngbya] sp. PCC 7376]